MMFQVVQPPTPAPDFPMPPPETISGPVAIILALVVVTGFVLVFLPLMRAIGRRIEGRRQLDPGLQEELQARAADVDALNQRVAELEERVDFTERMLAQRTAPERLPEGR